MSSLILGIRYSLYDFQRVKIDYVDFEKKIKNFKDDVSKKANLLKENLELVYCGNILDDEVTLSSSGLKPGVMVHVLKKKAKEVPKPIPTMTKKDIDALAMAFHALKLNPNYRNSLQKLSRPDILDNIVMMTPGLSHDPIAISLIQDPELLVRLGDVDTVKRILEHHPALVEAANHIAAAVHEDAVGSPSVQPSTSGYSYSLEALSEDEEMDSSMSSDSQTFQHQNFSGITAAQLAAAIASASNNATSSTSLDSGGITSEMFNQAIQQAIANVTPSTSPSSTVASSTAAYSTVASSTQVSASPSGTDGEVSGQQLAQQMQQMRELGLTNDALNIQALQLSGGNVYAAIDLVFSGAIGPTS